MCAKKGFLFYDKGIVDNRLNTTVEYKFTAIDVQYSKITKTVQIMFMLKHPLTREIFYFFEEFYPLSKRFKKFLDKICYIDESYTTKPVHLKEIRGISFKANLQYANGKVRIDLDSTVSIVPSLHRLPKDCENDELFL